MAGVKEEDLVEKHDIVFSKPMNCFLSTPYTTFIEMRTDEIWPIPKDLYSDVYTFTRNGNNVRLLLEIRVRINRCSFAEFIYCNAMFTHYD